jgi:hypothetical protein
MKVSHDFNSIPIQRKRYCHVVSTENGVHHHNYKLTPGIRPDAPHSKLIDGGAPDYLIFRRILWSRTFLFLVITIARLTIISASLKVNTCREHDFEGPHSPFESTVQHPSVCTSHRGSDFTIKWVRDCIHAMHVHRDDGNTCNVTKTSLMLLARAITSCSIERGICR